MNPNPSPGDIYYGDFPFSDAEKYKDRPVLLLLNVFGRDIIVCMVTHRKNAFDDCIEITNSDLVEGQLGLNPSYIRPARLFTANPGLFRRKAGRVNDTILQRVKRLLSERFAPQVNGSGVAQASLGSG